MKKSVLLFHAVLLAFAGFESPLHAPASHPEAAYPGACYPPSESLFFLIHDLLSGLIYLGIAACAAWLLFLCCVGSDCACLCRKQRATAEAGDVKH